MTIYKRSVVIISLSCRPEIGNRPQHGIALKRSPSLPPRKVVGLDTHISWTGAPANWKRYAATSAFITNSLRRRCCCCRPIRSLQQITWSCIVYRPTGELPPTSWAPPSVAASGKLIVQIMRHSHVGLKHGTQYPCLRAVSTVFTVDTAREHGPWTRVVCTELSIAHFSYAYPYVSIMPIWVNLPKYLFERDTVTRIYCTTVRFSHCYCVGSSQYNIIINTAVFSYIAV